MKKFALLTLAALLMLVLPSKSNAQVEKILINNPGFNLDKLKTITPEITGTASDMISMGECQVALLSEDPSYWEDYYTENKKSKKKSSSSIILICISYTVKQEWTDELDKKYKPELSISLSNLQDGVNLSQYDDYYTYLRKISNEDDEYEYYENAYSDNAVMQGIFGELEYKHNESTLREKSWYESEEGDWIFGTSDDDVSISLLKDKTGYVWTYAEVSQCEELFKKFNKIRFEVSISPTDIQPEVHDALIKIRNYCQQLNDMDIKSCSPELFSILGAIRDLRIKNHIDIENQERFRPIRENQLKIIEKVIDSCAKKDNPDAMLWSARIHADTYSYNNRTIKYYLTLACQGNTEAIHELNLIDEDRMNEDNWVQYLLWLKDRTDVGLYSTELFNQHLQYIKKNFFGITE